MNIKSHSSAKRKCFICLAHRWLMLLKTFDLLRNFFIRYNKQFEEKREFNRYSETDSAERQLYCLNEEMKILEKHIDELCEDWNLNR